MQAKALRLSGDTGIDALTFDTYDVPVPGPQEVLVRMRAVSLNQRDLMIAEGRYGATLEEPRILGSDGAGDVVAVGNDVTAFKPGDRVVAGFFRDWIDGELTFDASGTALGGGIDGTLTTNMLMPEHALVRIPEALTYEDAATLPCAAVTAWHALASTDAIGPDDTVLLLGTGGVSVVALQIAKMRGAKTIITSSSDEKLTRAKALGADETINYKTTPDWDKRVRELTGKRGVTHVVETGGGATLAQSLGSCAMHAQVSIIGLISGVEATIDLRQILGRCVRVQGIYVGSIAMLREVAEAMAAAGEHAVIDETFSFADAKDAFRSLKAAEHFGKIVITFP
ncbi:zinc-dependent alcohol dehydrogenase family protein [Terriglobus roseus]|uniref:NADPH:quinone reductase n=1 Tax=Terriglobus roseus TaxID=392734 RepID=A0A1H4RC13_9BACT|nr:NAD(P)-dependent alcohol dehydrogenase [Terriglobus roseus]SEC29430.1 NADPH:quinone reductase [Terriglobus roseus]